MQPTIPHLTITLAGPGEEFIVSAIAREASAWREAALGERLWTLEGTSPEYFRPYAETEQLRLARLKGEPVASMILQWEDTFFWPDVPLGESAFIHRLAVRRSVAGTGVSRAMIAHARDVVRDAGRRYLRLDTGPWPRLHALYEACGFVQHSIRIMGVQGEYIVHRFELDMTT